MQALLYMCSLTLLMEMRREGDGDPESCGALTSVTRTTEEGWLLITRWLCGWLLCPVTSAGGTMLFKQWGDGCSYSVGKEGTEKATWLLEVSGREKQVWGTAPFQFWPGSSGAVKPHQAEHRPMV